MSGVPSGSGGYVGGMEHRMDDDDANDDEFEVRNLLWRLWWIGILRGWFIIDRSGFPHSKPDSAASIKPRSKYEEFFLVSDPPAPVRSFMTLYRQVSEIQPTSSERAARLWHKSCPLFNILPLRLRAVSIDNNSDFCAQRFLNSDYSRICSSKSVPKSGAASIYF